MHSRVPSGRESSIGMAAGGGGQAGAVGTSTKPREMGGGVTGAAGGGAICFLRSVRRNRHCLATRAGGKAEASATA
jgi:hypothetical protein